MKPKAFLADLFIRPRLYALLTAAVFCYLLSLHFWVLMIFGHFIIIAVLIFFILEYALLFLLKNNVIIRRETDEVLSNTDNNPILIYIQSDYPFELKATLIDELPEQFQERKFSIHDCLAPNEHKKLIYNVRPTTRGEYFFGKTHFYVHTVIGLLQRRFSTSEDAMVKVYPSYFKIRSQAIQGVASQYQQSGSLKMRKGLSTEFDQIKDYVRGDDARTINWRATARRSQLMVNTYMDERAQQVFCLIDKSRLMKMPFDGVSLLDYAINATLMFSYVALHKGDKVGLITFSNQVNDIIKASKNRKQFNQIVERLYQQKTAFMESDYNALQIAVRRDVGQRSLLILFTNFETYVGFERKLPYFKLLNKKHLLCVVLFENTAFQKIHEQRGDSLEDIYIKTIADRYSYEKKMMIKDLRKNGILSIYTPPKDLSLNVVNKYLELKTKRFL